MILHGHLRFMYVAFSEMVVHMSTISCLIIYFIKFVLLNTTNVTNDWNQQYLMKLFSSIYTIIKLVNYILHRHNALQTGEYITLSTLSHILYTIIMFYG